MQTKNIKVILKKKNFIKLIQNLQSVIESLSSIILNCPKCNKTETVFSVTITSTCKQCNVNMFYVCNQCTFRFRTMPALYRHRKLQCKSTTNITKNKLSK